MACSAHGVYVKRSGTARSARRDDFVGKIRKESRFPTVAIAQAWLDRADVQRCSKARCGSFRARRSHKPKPGMMDDARWRAGYGRLAPLGLHSSCRRPGAARRSGAPRARFSGYTIVLNHTGTSVP